MPALLWPCRWSFVERILCWINNGASRGCMAWSLLIITAGRHLSYPTANASHLEARFIALPSTSASFLFSAGMRFQSTNTSAYGLKGWIGWHRKVRASLHDKLFNISCQELHILTISKLSHQRATFNQDAFNTNFPGWSCEEFEQMYYHVEWNAKKKRSEKECLFCLITCKMCDSGVPGAKNALGSKLSLCKWTFPVSYTVANVERELHLLVRCVMLAIHSSVAVH